MGMRNISRVFELFELYERLFTLKQGDIGFRVLSYTRGTLAAIHQTLVTVLRTLQEYRQDLVVIKFLFRLHPSLLTHVRE